MTTYHERSYEGGVANLDLFSLPLSEMAVEAMQHISYFPIAPVTEKTNVIEFNISTSDDFVDIGGASFSAEGKVIVDSEKEEIKAGDGVPEKVVALSNNLLHALIDRVDIFVNNVNISHTPQYFINAYLHVLMNGTAVERDNHLKTQLWFQAPAGKSEDLTAAPPGLATRIKLARNQRQIFLPGPLYTPLTRMRKYLVPGCTVTLRIHLTKPEISILESAGAGPSYKFQLSKAYIGVKHIRVNPRLRLTLERDALRAPFIYALPNYDILARYLPSESSSCSLENIGPVYHRLFLVFIKAAALIGDKGKDPFKFESCGLRQITLTRGSEKITYDGLDIPKDKFGEVYVETQRALGSPDVPLSPEHFKTDSFIVTFSLNPNNPASSLPPRSDSSTRIEMEFAGPLTEQYACLLFKNRPRIMEVTSKREVKVD